MTPTGCEVATSTAAAAGEPPARLSEHRALSLTQPWATLVAAGAKRVETRSWQTTHRGWLGIHASKTFPRWARNLCGKEPFASTLSALGIRDPEDLPVAALIGGVRVIACVPTSGRELAGISDVERAFGDYAPGRWAWMLADARSFPPRPVRGALKIWAIPEHACTPGATNQPAPQQMTLPMSSDPKK